MPFILIGVFVSAIIQNFISEETIQKALPKNKMSSVFIASLMGIVFPVCECGIVPIARRLVMKGVPLYSAATFMLAAPIINPVVFSSTAIAFTANPQVVWLRMGLAFVVSCLEGLALSILFRGRELREGAGAHSCGCGCNHQHEHIRQSFTGKIRSTIQDACDEFFEMGKYLILGAFLAAVAQTLISQSLLISIGSGS